MTDKLLPCPFCGGETRMAHTTQLWEPRKSYWAKCSSCHMSGRHYQTEAEAIAAWNTRAERTCRWEYPQGVNGWVGYMVCSSCGEKYDETVTDTARYCPNCGARIVEGEER